MSVLFTFPGQGAQKSGMLHALPKHPEVERTLAETSSVLGIDPYTLDTHQALESTRAVQLCLLVSGVAMARTLSAHGARPDMAAGFSIGEFPAAVIAGVLDYSDAVMLVAKRGSLMEQAYPDGYGMAAIIGLDRYQLEPLIARIHTRSTPVYLANLNAERQMVISGSEQALSLVMQLAGDHGASKTERLAVTVPSHCELFSTAAEEMSAAIKMIKVKPSSLTYLSSSAARTLFDPLRIADMLANNMARQVHWSETMRLAWERGARLAVEMPCGSVLTNLTSPLFTDGMVVSCDTTHFSSLVALISHR